MTSQREKNRAAMPAVAEMVDELRGAFGSVVVEFAEDETTGQTVGTPTEDLQPPKPRVPIKESVRCRGCRHRIPDAINPPQGLGRCQVRNVARWPDELRHCDEREE